MTWRECGWWKMDQISLGKNMKSGKCNDKEIDGDMCKNHLQNYLDNN